MTKKVLKKIFDRLDFCLKLDRNTQKSFEKFCRTVAPDSYTPIIARGSADGFIEGVCSSRDTEWLKEHLSYYAYELQSMEEAEGKDPQGKKYNLKKKSEYIDFVLSAR